MREEREKKKKQRGLKGEKRGGVDRRDVREKAGRRENSEGTKMNEKREEIEKSKK